MAEQRPSLSHPQEDKLGAGVVEIKTRLLYSASDAAGLLVAGKIVAFPTETVYGLGVDARNSIAVQRLFRAKGRPSDNPLIVHIDCIDHWTAAARELTSCAAKFLQAFAPGPITVVLPKHDSIADEVTAGLDTVGVRIPASSEARELLQLAAIPVAAPSANRSGRPSCTTWQSVMEDLQGRIDAVLVGSTSRIGVESTVVDCCDERPVLLRPGMITLEQLRHVVPSTIPLAELRACESKQDEAKSSGAERSPGLKHPHYRPQARVILVENAANLGDVLDSFAATSNLRLAYAGISPVADTAIFSIHRAFGDVDEYAAGYYEFLRDCDRSQVDVVMIETAPLEGVGHALRERQQRSAQG